ncbi:MAG: hypothetical protein CML46_10960 [Rhodobacteraceae bacterium]|nr:hypothetical protein [Paracoccaceae bacterium]MBR27446.1 hypothetical protein [Paracoccaceae bacterium]
MPACLVLTVAGLLAGALNAVAGGGTFLTFPALVRLGVPPIAANATATAGALPGSLGGALAFQRDIRAQGALGLLGIGLWESPGAVIGEPMLLAATGLFAAGPSLLQGLRGRGVGAAGAAIDRGLRRA